VQHRVRQRVAPVALPDRGAAVLGQDLDERLALDRLVALDVDLRHHHRRPLLDGEDQVDPIVGRLLDAPGHLGGEVTELLQGLDHVLPARGGQHGIEVVPLLDAHPAQPLGGGHRVTAAHVDRADHRMLLDHQPHRHPALRRPRLGDHVRHPRQRGDEVDPAGHVGAIERGPDVLLHAVARPRRPLGRHADHLDRDHLALEILEAGGRAQLLLLGHRPRRVGPRLAAAAGQEGGQEQDDGEEPRPAHDPRTAM